MVRHGLGMGMFAAIATIAPLQAQEPSSAQLLQQALQACVAERDDARRLACFDRAMQASAPLVPGAPVMSPQQRFGFTGELARKARDASGETAQELRELDAVVAAVATRGYGQLSVTLDNGQVWSQKAAGQFFRIKVGDRVTVKSAALGSFLLVDAEGRSIRVSRVK